MSQDVSPGNGGKRIDRRAFLRRAVAVGGAALVAGEDTKKSSVGGMPPSEGSSEPQGGEAAPSTTSIGEKVAISAGIAAAGAAAVVGVAAIPAVQRSLTYKPNENLDKKPVPPIQPPEVYGLEGIKAVTLETAQGEDFLTWQSTEFKRGKKTLVLFPGNFGHLGQAQYVNYIKAAQQEGYQIMAVEHVGFAGSTAKPSQAGMFRGVEKVLEELAGKGIQPEDMSLVGISMGTTLAAHAANFLADLNAFKNYDRQHIRCLMVSGALNAGVILNDMLPPIASDIANAVWREQFDTGKELQTISPAVGKRVHVTYLRGKDDKWTPADQVEAHKQAAAHLDFSGKEVAGEHFPEPSILLSELKSMDAAVASTQARVR